jgi:hypothetical protein
VTKENGKRKEKNEGKDSGLVKVLLALNVS